MVEEEIGGVAGGFRGREKERNGSFTLLDVFVACNTRPGEFGSPGRADPTQILLLRLKTYISYSRCYISNLNGQNVQNWVASLQSKFESDPTVNESGIAI